jgi:toxin-antitoxin system PIN domain toxin
MNGEELIGLPNEVCLGFVRIATNPRLGSAVVALTVARTIVDGWLALPQVRVLAPGPDHFSRVMDLTAQAMGSGTLISDAALAVYALQHRATLYSNDTDFARFAGLNWVNPLAP